MFTVRSASRLKSVCLALLLLAIGLGSIAVPQPKLALAAGTTYYFSTTGNDTNNGTSVLTPKQSITAANALLSAGNTVLFKRGDAWYKNSVDSVNGTGANIGGSLILYGRKGTLTNPITIGAYGTGAKPMISTTHLLDDAGWIYDGSSNRWKHALPSNTDALRLFVNGVSKYKVNTTNSSANETHVDQTYEWYINPTTGWVYANSGSSASGPKNVELILASNAAPVSMGNTEYVTVQNLDIKGGVVSVDSPSAHITIDNNTIRQSNQTGIRVYNSSTTNFTAHVSNITITNNVIDKVWTTYENDPAIFLSGDGIYMHDAAEGGLIRGNKIVNFGHSGIELASTISTSYHGVHHVIVEQNDVSAGDSGYMHAFGVYGLPGETTDNMIRRNYFHNFTSVSHAGGSDNQFYSNIFAGVKLTPQPKHSQQPYALDIAPWGSMEARDLYIVNNTFLNTDHFSIQVTDYNAAPSNVTNNVIANNIFGQYGFNDNANGAIGEVALDVSNAVTGTLYVNNNAFWDSSSNVARFKDISRSVLYDIDGLNSCPHTTPDTCDANLKVNDPGFVDYANRDFRLSASSLVKASGTNAYAAALGSGFVDFYGNPWHPTTPSIGAIQYGPAAPSNLSAGRAPSYSSTVLYEASPSNLTDGYTTYYVGVGDAHERVYAQIDLGALYDVSKVKMWHFFSDGRTYKDVIVQLSQTADFSSYVTTVFNNDKDNSAGQGYGVDSEYAEGAGGKTVSFQPILARYARFWIGGNNTDPYNQFVELQVYGTTP
ncbi:right-handed parallel beta-helix repeat-containing protein [Cohnella sp. JJ-181]|uniref:right-handed parallel beta-helix repeat-containing protein n=1 Tax=Cohnella rhizoplanae TaxID=2974897 RepID=UPI0022FFB6D9|nr:right-handed parallel beta-helix repeat-containing protein [Cohnella sp. JJ-181]CAI6079335.1 hypothetical protein COHCIP112018_02751 [Cohnella sp. JJ-181]